MNSFLKNYKYEVLLIFILLLASFLRIYRLSYDSIWYDEAMSYVFSNLNFLQLLRETTTDTNPPLYYIILHLTLIFFGKSEFVLRFPSAIFSILSVLLIYKIGRELFSKETGIIAAFLLSISILNINWSQDARAYSLLVLTCLLSNYFLLKILKNKQLKHIILYILSTTLLAYSHNYGLFLIAAQNIYFLTSWISTKRFSNISLRAWIIYQFLISLLYLPWFHVMLKQTLKLQKGFWTKEPNLDTLKDTFIYYSARSEFLLGIFLVLLLFSIYKIEKVEGKIQWKNIFNSVEKFSWDLKFTSITKIYFLFIWLFVPIFIPFLISKFSQPFYLIRHTMLCTPAFYLLVSNGLKNIPSTTLKLLLIIVISFISMSTVKEYHEKEVKRINWREATNYLESNAEKNDILFFYPDVHGRGINPFNYYSTRNDLLKVGFTYSKNTFNKDVNNIPKIIKSKDSFWLIIWGKTIRKNDEKDAIFKKLKEIYSLKEYNTFYKIEIYKYERN